MRSCLLILILLVSAVASAQELTNEELKNRYLTFSPGEIISSEEAIFNYNQISRSNKPYDPLIIGVFRAGLNFSDPRFFPNPIQNEGIAEVRYNSENGNIKEGDLLTSSSEPGVAMKATKSGIIIGIAIDDAKGSDGLVKTRLMLQYLKQ